MLCDPIVVNDEVFTISGKPAGRELGVSLSVYDASTGQLRRRRPVGSFRQSWYEHRSCAMTVEGDSLLVAAGGGVLCCGLDGEVRWMRTQAWLAPFQHPRSITQHTQAPLVHQERMFVAQPGVPTVECLAPDDGRLLWSQTMPDVRRIVGLVGGRLVVEIDSGLIALDIDSGRALWEHRTDGMLDAKLGHGPPRVLYARSRPAKAAGRQFAPQLVWVDATTGRASASAMLEELTDADPKFGPLLVGNSGLWAFFGRGLRDANRQVVQLLPSGAAEGPPPDLVADDLWAGDIP